MKKLKKAALITAALTASISMASCDTQKGSDSSSAESTVDIASSYDPASDDIANVYGPPVAIDKNANTTETSNQS